MEQIQILEPLVLNTQTYFCKGCGISPAAAEGERCRTCVTKADASGFGIVLRVKVAAALRRMADAIWRA